MTERKGKRNAQTLKSGEGFRIRKKPVVRVAVDHRQTDLGDSVSLPRVSSAPILFAIARDSCTIFASWNVDWTSVFEKAMPVDRQVHLRVYRADGLEEKSVAVEPMVATHYVTIPELCGSRVVEIGYYEPAEVWHSVATSNEVVMPPNCIAEAADVHLATLPFHLSFQRLLDLFGVSNEASLATVMSQFQKRALSSEQPETVTGEEEEEILRKLHVSTSEIAAARRAFDKIDRQKLAKRTRALLRFGSTSPTRGFEGDWGSAGS
ncbi:MAG TPA: DUF4912 domain-containing protein [Candidatus Limnocylindria bacterium]|nr:DUF4912 domain-containing protein [Candidatus Limnocylindria bacterium]